MGVTPNLQLPYPEEGDSPDGPAQVRALAEALDSATLYDAGPADALTPPGKVGRRYYETDTGLMRLDIGAAWVLPAANVLNNSITDAKVADATLTGGKFADGTIPGSKLADGTLGTAKLGDGQVSLAKLAAALRPDEAAGGNDLAVRALGFGPGQAAPGNSPLVRPLYVNALPPAPTDGQEIFYTVPPPYGAFEELWRFRYRQAAISSHKWEASGPQTPIFNEQMGAFDTASANEDGGGPALTMPLAGDYWVTMEAEMSTVDWTVGWAAVAINGNLASIDLNNRISLGARNNPGTSHIGTRSRAWRINNLAAGDRLEMFYTSGSGAAGTIRFTRRRLIAQPLRVG